MKPVHTLSIDSLAFGGNGVGRIDGKVCFVPYSCPGDQVLVEIASEKRSYQEGRIKDILVSSAHRVTPECPLFGRCGGCSWQHVNYAQQLDSKKKILVDALWRSAKVESGVVQSVIPSCERYGYRNRVQLKLHGKGAGLKIGFFRPNSHYVEELLTGCPLANPAINQVLTSLKEVFVNCTETPLINEIQIDSAENGVVAIVEYVGNNQKLLCDYLISRMVELMPLTGVYLYLVKSKQFIRIFGDEFLFYTLITDVVEHMKFKISYVPGSFSQVNRKQNQVLLDIVLQMVTPDGNVRILDLFCGNGNFSLPLCHLVSSVFGVESYAPSVVAAKHNCEVNDIRNATYVCADSAHFLKRSVKSGATFDVVILDPPRGGAADIVCDICRLHPIKIVYVSCDPNTLARDCALFVSNGYTVKKTVPLDMFPQTWHLESVTLIEKQLTGVL